MSTHEKTVSIQQAVGSEVNLAGYQKNGDAKVTINLENEADGKKGNMIQNADGTYGRPVQIGLGHELKHAENYMDGTQDNTAVNVVNPDKNTNPEKNSQGKVVTTEMDEVNVRNFENKLREEQGVVPRAPLVPIQN